MPTANTTDGVARLAPALADAIAQLRVIVTPEQQQQLLQFLALLHKWNQTYNLSGLHDLREMFTLHIIDSLTLLPFIDRTPVADIGTGAGLPGLVLAICKPDTQFVLIDSNSKKTRFIFQAVAALGLRNVQVVHARAEDYAMVAQVAIVTSRAFASLRDFVASSQHMLQPAGSLLAMKGQHPLAEIAELPAEFEVVASTPVQVPGATVTRHVLDIRRCGWRDHLQ